MKPRNKQFLRSSPSLTVENDPGLSTSGGLNVVAAKLDTGASEQTSQTRQFDPQWLAPLIFLDQADQRGMIVRDLANARIGKLLLVSGRLAIFDLGMLRNAWEIGAIRDVIIQSAQTANVKDQTPQRGQNQRDRQRQERQARDAATKQIGAGLEFIKLLPHGIIGSVRTGEAKSGAACERTICRWTHQLATRVSCPVHHDRS